MYTDNYLFYQFCLEKKLDRRFGKYPQELRKF